MQGIRIYLFAFLLLASACRSGRQHFTPKMPHSNLNAKEKIQANKALQSFLTAEILRLQGDLQDAIQAYTIHLKNYPQSDAAHFALSRILYSRNRLNESEEHARKACELSPKNTHYLEHLLHLCIYQGKLAEAEKMYPRLLELKPRNMEILYRYAMLAYRQGAYSNAIDRLCRVEDITGFNEDVILQKKGVYLKMNKTEEAVAELMRIKMAYPRSAEWVLQMADVYQEAGRTADYDRMYYELAKNYRNEPVAQMALLQFYNDKKDTASYRAMMQAMMLNPNLETEQKISVLRASLNTIQGAENEPESLFYLRLVKSLHEQSPSDLNVLSLYADMLSVFGQVEEALPQYKKLVDRDHSRFSPYQQIMLAYTDQKSYDSVLVYAAKSKLHFPNEPMVFLLEGNAWQMQKKYDSALNRYQIIFTLRHVQAELKSEILSSMGDVYHQLKQYARSDSCFDAALMLNPKDASVLNNYAYYLSLRKDKLERAEKMSQESLRIQPNTQSFLDTYGWILFQQGKFADAKKYIEQAVALEDADAVLLEHLGDVYFKLNEKQKAVEYWKKALEKGNTDPKLQRKMQDETWYE